MTVTINIPSSAEKPLQAEAARVGLTPTDLIERVLAERFHDEENDSLAQLVKDVGGAAPTNVDLSREGIYADF